jgi:hypothetical protein
MPTPAAAAAPPDRQQVPDRRTLLAQQLLLRADELNASLLASDPRVDDDSAYLPERKPRASKPHASVKVSDKRLVAEEEVCRLRESAAHAQRQVAAAKERLRHGRLLASHNARKKDPSQEVAITPKEQAEEATKSAQRAKEEQEERAMRIELERMRKQLQHEQLEVRRLRERELALAGVLASLGSGVGRSAGKISASSSAAASSTASRNAKLAPSAKQPSRVRWADS